MSDGKSSVGNFQLGQGIETPGVRYAVQEIRENLIENVIFEQKLR